jgi:hypothetical protein
MLVLPELSVMDWATIIFAVLVSGWGVHLILTTGCQIATLRSADGLILVLIIMILAVLPQIVAGILRLIVGLAPAGMVQRLNLM